MTVQDLINKLSTFDPQLEVVLSDITNHYYLHDNEVEIVQLSDEYLDRPEERRTDDETVSSYVVIG